LLRLNLSQLFRSGGSSRCLYLLAQFTQPLGGWLLHNIGDDHSYDRARRAVSRGEVLPIEKILEHVRAQVPGQILEIEFDQENGRWVYEFKIIDDEGRLLEAYFDAQSGKLLSAEED